VVEQCDIAIIKLPTQKVQGIPNWHLCEERDDVKGDYNIIQLDLESVQCVDEILRIPHMVQGVT